MDRGKSQMMHKMWANVWSAVRLTPLAALVAGCAPEPGLRQAPGTLTELHYSFDAAPARLFAVAAEVCTDPAQRIARPSSNTVECRSLLPPENTAAAILAFDGTISDLPESVIRFAGSPGKATYLVRATVYLEIPREGKTPVQVQVYDPEVWQRLAGIMTATGGQPVPQPAKP